MVKRLKLGIDYDIEGDILNVFLGKPYATDNYGLDFNYTLRFNRRNHALVGIIVLQFSRLFPKAPDPKARRLVAETLFTLFDRLYREKMLREPRVA